MNIFSIRPLVYLFDGNAKKAEIVPYYLLYIMAGFIGVVSGNLCAVFLAGNQGKQILNYLFSLFTFMGMVLMYIGAFTEVDEK